MGTPLCVLLVEDCEDDAALLLRALRKGGYEPKWERVETARALTEALKRRPWQLVTCDCVMPQFDAVAALKVISREAAGLPAIVVSGETGAELRTSALQAGALDYVSKDELDRLAPAVGRALKHAAKRRTRGTDR